MSAKGWRDMRVNRKQVSAEGKIVGRNRPDVSGINPKTGERVNIEFDNSAKASQRHRETVSRNDPDARNAFILLK
jgi:nucleoid DNA-binding protein